MKRCVLSVAAVLLFALSFISPVSAEESILDKVKQAGVVKIGSGNTTPPLNYVDEKGNWTGFDIDLGDAMAGKLGVKLERVLVDTKTRNPDNVKALMCRELLCISYDGRLYDCGYHQIEGVPVKSKHAHIDYFDYDALSKREIANTPICFVCTAGTGIGCECGKIRPSLLTGTKTFNSLS